jgi:hypothetical protein
MSRLEPFARLLVKSHYLTRKFFDFYTQLIVHAPSSHSIKQSRSLAHFLGKDRLGVGEQQREEIFNNLALLRCFEIPDSELVRIGPSHDGGYVIYKEISEITKVISIGVAEDTSFEEDFCSRNSITEFFLFDHTVTPKRKLPKNFNFYSLGLNKDVKSQFVNLDYIVDTHLTNSDKSILKIDIEGSEYEALSETKVEVLDNFEQILIEIHEVNEEKLSSILFKQLLAKFRDRFNLVHVHGNNNDGYSLIRGACVPQTIELTFVNKKIEINEVVGSAIFPRGLDFPNTTGDDLALGAFKFKTY